MKVSSQYSPQQKTLSSETIKKVVTVGILENAPHGVRMGF